MSTFTEWNGPPGGRGPSTKDVLALIDAYNNMSAVLSKHLESTAADNVHSFASALKEAISGLESSVNASLALKADADTVSSLAEAVSDLQSRILIVTQAEFNSVRSTLANNTIILSENELENA